jgi:hypothetical protein
MTTSSAAPSQADAPGPLARAILRARFPAALQVLLLALLAALAMAQAPRRALHLLRQDWFFSANPDADTHPDSALDPFALHRIRRLRARLGWLLRCAPHEGLSLSGHRAPELRPTRLARAPPKSVHTPNPPQIRRQNPASRGDNACPNPTFAGAAKEPEKPIHTAVSEKRHHRKAPAMPRWKRKQTGSTWRRRDEGKKPPKASLRLSVSM